MKRYYPPIPLSWAHSVASLTPSEIAYGIHQGILDNTPADEEQVQGKLPGALEGGKLVDARDVLFRLLLVHLYKQWFSINCPLRALEFLVLDFEDCPTAGIGHGRLLSGIAGISEGKQTAELDPEYFEQKVRVFRFLTEFVIEIVREHVRKNYGDGALNRLL
jgi:hypothetical protein